MPTVVVVDGPAVSGPALLLGLADFTVMTEDSYAFVNGPAMVEEFTGRAITTEELGGAGQPRAPHRGGHWSSPTSTTPSRRSATSSPICPPRRRGPTALADDDPARSSVPGGRRVIPPTSTGSYDVRRVAAAIVDED